MKTYVHCVGKLKESFYREACDEYIKRLSSYAKIEIVEEKDLPIPENASVKEEEEVKNKEGAKILSRLKPSDLLIALDLGGKEMTSEVFSSSLMGWLKQGGSNLHFVIGGSLGLSDELKKRAHARIAFGEMTFPHGLARVMLLEQIYRGFKIASNEPYHK